MKSPKGLSRAGERCCSLCEFQLVAHTRWEAMLGTKRPRDGGGSRPAMRPTARGAAAVRLLALLGALGDPQNATGDLVRGRWSADVVQQPRARYVARLGLRGGAEKRALCEPSHGAAMPAPAAAGTSTDLLAQLSKDTLQAELERRGCDTVGAKSVLAIRLNRVMAEGDAPGAHRAQPDGVGLHALGHGRGGGEGDMMDVDAAGRSAAPPAPASSCHNDMRRTDARGQRRRGRLEHGRRDRLPRSGSEGDGGRDAVRSWEALKSGSTKVSSPGKVGAFRSSRGGREGGREGRGARNAGTSSSPHGAGDVRGRPYIRLGGGRQRGGRGLWRGRGGGEDRGGWRGGGAHGNSLQRPLPEPDAHRGQSRPGQGQGGTDVAAFARGDAVGDGDKRPIHHPQVLVAGAQVGEKFGGGRGVGIGGGGGGGGAFGSGRVSGGAFGGTGAGAHTMTGATGALPPLPPLPGGGMGDDSL